MATQGDLFGGWPTKAEQDNSPLPNNGWMGDAMFSSCRKYRYELQRNWSDGSGDVLVVMLNPSDANALENDPTVQRVCGFARAARMNRLVIANMFAFITPYPSKMVEAHTAGVDVVGPDNDVAISVLAMRAKLVVVAWGTCSEAPKLARQRARALCFGDGPLAGRDLHALRVTKDGAPSHPLYLPASCKFESYSRSDLERWCTGKSA